MSLRSRSHAGKTLVLALALWSGGCGSSSEDQLTLSGNIELTQVDIAFNLPGQIVAIEFEEGDLVQAGQVLARLDDAQLRQQRRQAEATVKANQSRFRELQAQLAFQQRNTVAQIERSGADVAEAQSLLKALVSGSRPQEIEQARAAATRAESVYEKAARDWERAQGLTVEKDISRAQYDEFKAAFEAAAASLEEARERLALVIEGPRMEDIEAAQARVARAEAARRQAEALRLDLQRLQRAIETTQAEVERAQAELARVEDQLQDTEAVSPLNGVILVKSAEPGEVLPAGVPVGTIGDLDRPWMRAYIPATALGRVRLGQPATVTTDSYPGKEYPGRVTFISSEAEFTPKQIQTAEQRTRLVYRVKIQLDNPNQELKLNMPCEARIQLQSSTGDGQNG